MIYQCECGGHLKPKLNAIGITTGEWICLVCGTIYQQDTSTGIDSSSGDIHA